MRVLTSLLVVAAVGCGVGEPAEPPATSTVESALACPDPPDCTVHNGGGIYTEEFGAALMGSDMFMLLRFVNTGTGVDVVGRHYDSALAQWFVETRTLSGAVYGGHLYVPTQVTEDQTLPTWTLHDEATNTDTTVSGAAAVNLKLKFTRDADNYTLSFTSTSSEGTAPAIQKFNMQWSKNGEPAQQYCYRAPGIPDGAADPVVFQQGIGVNPDDATVGRNASYVTVSCRHGAMATVRLWGYTYTGAGTYQTNLFDMGLRMKRASYCGDESFYTRAGTEIKITDDIPIQSSASSNPSLIEASWGWVTYAGTAKFRATCVNMPKRRHRLAEYPPGSGILFSPTCPDGFTIPACSLPLGRMYDEADPPGP
jgi:hypothetical protein